MEKDETIATFLSTIFQIRSQLMAIGDKVEDDDLVQTVFDGLVFAFHTPEGDMAEIFKPLSVSFGASLESRLSPCS